MFKLSITYFFLLDKFISYNALNFDEISARYNDYRKIGEHSFTLFKVHLAGLIS